MTARLSWPLWSTTAELVAVDPAELEPAREVAEITLAEVEVACSRYREDSELRALEGRDRIEHPVSAMLARLLADALSAARASDGLVDPTLGDRLEDVGFTGAPGVRVALARRATWREVKLEGGRITAPAGAHFDLGAVGKASAADILSERLEDDPRVRHGVLISLGGDLRAAGTGPEGGWQVEVCDDPADPAQQIRLHDSGALATSSTLHRRRLLGEHEIHHILDPRRLAPIGDTWRTVTCAGATCVRANTASTAAIVLGDRAPAWLSERRIPGRLVDADRRVVSTGSWPVPQEAHHG